MPVIKSAKKKLRKDKKLTQHNGVLKALLSRVLKKAKKTPSDKTVKEASKIADKAAKKHIIHKNKAARIKSALARLLASPTKKSTNETKTSRKTPQKPKKAAKKKK